MTRLGLFFATLLLMQTALQAQTKQRLLFHDDFGPASRGERVPNLVSEPPPKGMGYRTDTPNGYLLKHWLIADSEPNLQRRAFWCIPENAEGEVEAVGKQAARSHNSVAFARTMIPDQASAYTIEFRQWCLDNDTIGFVLGAPQPAVEHGGSEFSYQRQLPGTDTTVNDIYYRGALGEGKIEGVAFMRQWVQHRIDVDLTRRHVTWLQNGQEILSGEVPTLRPGGYFGIRQRYERGTRYDDVKITIAEPARDRGTKPPPNVLFIAVDDLRTDLGCYGNEAMHSPHIDQLASEGVRFHHAYCQYPICNASRASVLTGLRPDSTGANRNHTNNSFHFRSKIPDAVTLPQRFQQAGYRVGRVGKLYHYGVPREIGKESALDDRQSWQFALYPRGAEKDEEDQLINYTPEKGIGWALSWMESKLRPEEHTDGKVATEAIRLMSDFRNEPFFLAVGFYRPHMPATAPSGAFTPYPLDSVHLPNDPAEHLQHIPEPAFDRRLQTKANLDDLRRFKRAYLATITYVDQQIGRVLAGLDELGLWDNTIVVLWSDHGWMLGEHGQWEKRVLFEESLRVPLVIHAPSAQGNGKASERMVELVDLYPTLTELCGLSTPENLEGKSLAPLLQEPTQDWPSPAFSQIGREDVVGRSVRTPRWRYTEWDHGAKGSQLYDHHADPRELRNLAGDPTHRDTVDALRSRLREHFLEESPSF